MWKTCRPKILPSIQSLDSDTFKVNRSQLKLPNRPATRLGAGTQCLSASFIPADFESLIIAPISSWVWQQWYWRRLGTHLPPLPPRKCSSDISAIPYTLLLLSAAGIFIPVETQPDSNLAAKSNVVYRLRTTFVSQQSNRKIKRSRKRKPDLAIRRNQMYSARPSRDPSCCQSSLSLADPADPGQVRGAGPATSPPANSGSGGLSTHPAPAFRFQPLSASNKLNSLQDLSMALFLETRLAWYSILSQRHLDSTKWN